MKDIFLFLSLLNKKFYIFILFIFLQTKVTASYNLTKYDIQKTGVTFATISTTVNGNLVCSSWDSNSFILNFYGIKKNGRPYFIQSNQETYFYNTTTSTLKDEGMIYGINLDKNNDEKEYIISFGKNNAKFELYNFNERELELFSIEGKKFFNTNHNSFTQLSLFNLNSNKKSYILSFISNRLENSEKSFFLYLIKFNKKEINETDFSPIKASYIETSIDSYISSCYESDNDSIICFYFIPSGEIQITSFKIKSSNNHEFESNIIKKITIDNFHTDLFYKCVHFVGNKGAFLYYQKSEKVVIDIIEIENKDYNITKSISINNINYNNNIRKSDFIKLADKKICFLSSNSEEIKLIIIINYEDNFFNVKEYKLNLYQTNNLYIDGDTKISLYNGFIAMTVVAKLNGNYEKNSFFLIFSYPESEDFEIDITNDFMNSIDPEIDFNNKGNIQNNLFDFIPNGFIILNYTSGLVLIDSSSNKEVLKNDISNNKIILKLTQNINFNDEIKIEFAFTAKEPECDIYNDDPDYNNPTCNKGKDFSQLQNYIGKTSYCKIIIDLSKTKEDCSQYCHICSIFTDECLICKDNFVKSRTNNIQCIGQQSPNLETTKEPSIIISGTQRYSNFINNGQEYSYVIESSKIIKNESKICTNDQILNNECSDGEITFDQYIEIKNSLININNINENNIIKTEKIIIQFASLDEQKNSDDGNISSVDLKDCENILRTTYNLSDGENLIIYKTDIKSEDLSSTYVVYEIYDSFLNQLNLSYCSNTKISISIPVVLEENIQELVNSISDTKYDIFNEKDSFYNDICSTYTNINGSDMLLSDRKTDIYTVVQSQALCQTGCDLESYNTVTKKANCDCQTNFQPITELNVADDSFSTKSIAESFYKTLTNSNFQVMVCYKLIFDFIKMKNNYGEILMTILFMIFLGLLILYFILGPKSINRIINDILEYKKLYSQANNSNLKNNIIIYDQGSNSLSNLKNSKKRKKKSKNKKAKFKNVPPKKNKIKYVITSTNLKDKKKIGKGEIRCKTENDNKMNKKMENDQDKNSYGALSVTNNKLNEDIDYELYYKNLNDQEINTLEYDKAIKCDKRTYFQYYFSLLKKKQLLLFTFIPVNDYNLIYVKIALFIVSFSLYFTINGFFFTDETMHEIYEDNGSFNILHQIPLILYSSIISSVINIFLKQLSLSEKNILEIKNCEMKLNSPKINKIVKYLKIKLTLFFIFSVLLMSFFWYFISCFCAVYINTQTILIEDTIISFITSMLYPFGLCLLPGIFRIPALKEDNQKNKCRYKFSLIVAII